jgi:hypothetical protein
LSTQSIVTQSQLFANDHHWIPAMLTENRRAFRLRCWLQHHDSEQDLLQLNQPLAVGMQDAKITHTPKSLGQHVLQE